MVPAHNGNWIMAFRRPLYNNGNQLQEMSDTMINEIRSQMFWKFIESPSVSLSVVASGGNVGTISDTRLQAGSAITGYTTDYPTEAETAEPSVVTVNYDRIDQTVASVSTSDPSNIAYPIFYTAAGHIQSMTYQDIIDTFASSVVSELIAGGEIYTIGTTTTVSGYTLVSSTNVYADTRADTTAYTSDGIPEVADQPFTVQNYYLHKRNASSSSYTPPLKLDSSGNIISYSASDFDTLLSDTIRYVAANEVGYRIRFNYNGDGSNCGSGMTDTRLNGSGNYQTYQTTIDDYRAQEFPDGTAVTINTYYLRNSAS
jgi:hypothetical protein